MSAFTFRVIEECTAELTRGCNTDYARVNYLRSRLQRKSALQEAANALGANRTARQRVLEPGEDAARSHGRTLYRSHNMRLGQIPIDESYLGDVDCLLCRRECDYLLKIVRAVAQ